MDFHKNSCPDNEILNASCLIELFYSYCYDIMSASEREQAEPIQRERRIGK